MANRTLIYRRRQGGTSLVEFALTLSLFLLIVIGIIEFSVLVMNLSRANETTRELSRIAIVSDPLCDIYGGGCPGPASSLVCPGTNAVRVTLDQVGMNCSSRPNSTACRMFNVANAFLPGIQPEQIEVSYACSNTGAPERPLAIPLVTVALRNMTHTFMLPGLVGIDAQVAFPDFETSRTGEDLHSE